MSSVSENQAAKEQVSSTSTLSIAWAACSRSCESPIPPDGMTNKYRQQGWWQNKILDMIWNRWIVREILGIQNQAKIFCHEKRCELMGGEVQPSSAACVCIWAIPLAVRLGLKEGSKQELLVSVLQHALVWSLCSWVSQICLFHPLGNKDFMLPLLSFSCETHVVR